MHLIPEIRIVPTNTVCRHAKEIRLGFDSDRKLLNRFKKKKNSNKKNKLLEKSRK